MTKVSIRKSVVYLVVVLLAIVLFMLLGSLQNPSIFSIIFSILLIIGILYLKRILKSKIEIEDGTLTILAPQMFRVAAYTSYSSRLANYQIQIQNIVSLEMNKRDLIIRDVRNQSRTIQIDMFPRQKVIEVLKTNTRFVDIK